MKKILPVIIAVLSITAVLFTSTPAEARKYYARVDQARNQKPPSWDQYCYRVRYHSKKVGHFCEWKPVSIRELTPTTDYEIMINANRAITVDTGDPLFLEGSTSNLRSFEFSVKGNGVLPEEVQDTKLHQVIQIKNQETGLWENITDGYGTVIQGDETSIFEKVDVDFALHGHIEALENVEIRFGIMYEWGRKKGGLEYKYGGVKTSICYKGAYKPHYVFTPTLRLNDCFDPAWFTSDFQITDPILCGSGIVEEAQLAPNSVTPVNDDEDNDGPDMTDTDGDGFRDEWEIQRGSDPNDPNSVPNNWDGDDASNNTEINCGSDPNDPESRALDNDIDCDGICDNMDSNDNDGPCGDTDVEGEDEVEDDIETDLDEDYDNDNEDLVLDEDEYNVNDLREEMDAEPDSAGGGCSLNQQATSTSLLPLFMAFAAAMSLVVIRKKQ